MKSAVTVKEDTSKEVKPQEKHPQEAQPMVSTGVVEETRMLNKLRQEMNKLFDEFNRNIPGAFGFGSKKFAQWLEPLSEFHAKVDMKDAKKEIVVTAELPGVDMKDVEVTITDHHLTIKGEKKSETEEKGKDYYKTERNYGSFHRYLNLPCAVEKDSVHATYKDGVLTVTLPKTKDAIDEEKKITVEAG